MADAIYQHFVLGGSPGHFTTVFDEDPSTLKVWPTYNAALLYAIGVLAQSRI